MVVCWFFHVVSGARSAVPNSCTMVVQFMPEARPLTARLAAVLLTLLLEVPMLDTVLIDIISLYHIGYFTFHWTYIFANARPKGAACPCS